MPQLPPDAIVLTGCGWVTPFAAGPIDDVLREARHRRPMPPPEATFWAIPDDLREGFSGFSAELNRDRGAWVTAAAFEHARRSAGLFDHAVPPERTGLVLGCALAGQLGMIAFAGEVREQFPRFVSPINFPKTVGNYVSGALARAYNIRGPNSTLACGTASGLDAMVEACGLVANGMADVVFAGGTDTLSPELALGLTRPTTTLSEGACLFSIERADHAAARGAPILAGVVDVAQLADRRSAEAALGTDLVSNASGAREGVIWIEHWIGDCLGCLGAAAAAAAVGAARGHEVPVCCGGEAGSVDVRRLHDPQARGTGPIAGVVLAAAGDGEAHHTRLRLSMMPRS